jgi:uncharacterized membrane protein YgaE (UPF0421/DUF939 family)
VRSREVLEVAAERSRTGFRERVDRLRTLGPTLLLGAVAAAGSWQIAVHVVGPRGAFFAPVAAIITLGLTVGERLKRAIEMTIGVPLGIVLADLLVLALGSGWWQLTVIVLISMVVAVLLGGGPLLVTQSAVSAILVVTLPQPSGFSFTRATDAFIGCGVVLILNFLIVPIDPLRLVRREAEPVVRELAGVLDEIAGALERRDRSAALEALRRARDIDAHTQRLLEALNVGRETVAAAPQRRSDREPLAVYREAGRQIDLAVRNVRVLARGTLRAIDVGDAVPPDVPAAIRELREAVSNVDPWLSDAARTGAVREPAVRAARRASAVLEQTSNLSVSVIVGQIRSTAVDLLRSTGMEPDDARREIRGGPQALADA